MEPNPYEPPKEPNSESYRFSLLRHRDRTVLTWGVIARFVFVIAPLYALISWLFAGQ